jgi:hypothetical protein
MRCRAPWSSFRPFSSSSKYSDRVACAWQRVLYERFERCLAVKALLRSQHLDDEIAERRLVGRCQYGEARAAR